MGIAACDSGILFSGVSLSLHYSLSMHRFIDPINSGCTCQRPNKAKRQDHHYYSVTGYPMFHFGRLQAIAEPAISQSVVFPNFESWKIRKVIKGREKVCMA